jgi:hypothetical protein
MLQDSVTIAMIAVAALIVLWPAVSVLVAAVRRRAAFRETTVQARFTTELPGKELALLDLGRPFFAQLPGIRSQKSLHLLIGRGEADATIGEIAFELSAGGGLRSRIAWTLRRWAAALDRQQSLAWRCRGLVHPDDVGEAWDRAQKEMASTLSRLTELRFMDTLGTLVHTQTASDLANSESGQLYCAHIKGPRIRCVAREARC